MNEPGLLFRERVRHIHFVGVGGIGMSGIAEIFIDLGYIVTGSDLRENENVERLRKHGAVINIGHDPDAVEGADVVVYSSAIRPENPELIRARNLDIPVIPRAEMLAELMRFGDGIAVAGTHGKTTTTSLFATLLAKQDPTVVIGGKLNAIGTNARRGSGGLIVVEADESDGSFLFLRPLITCVTNIDEDHMDHYASIDEIMDSFTQFCSNIPFYGFNIICIDNENCRELVERVHRRNITYGFSRKAHYQATNMRLEGTGSRYTVVRHGVPQGDIHIHMLGRHNVLNSLAAVVLGMELGIPFPEIAAALESFSGVDRRFSIRGEAAGVLVVDDYAHHPTEIAATLSAARQGYPQHRLWAVLQPHRYTRVQALFTEFGRAFFAADEVVVTDIYSAGEAAISGINSQALAESISRLSNKKAVAVGDLDATLEHLASRLEPGDLVLMLGAGSITSLSRRLLERLRTS